MIETFKDIREFPGYSVSDWGHVRNNDTGRLLALSTNQYDTVCVGLMKDGGQKHRSVALLVARAFMPQLNGQLDTPIHLDGDKNNNASYNLLWRPRWFAVKYQQQFTSGWGQTINRPFEDIKTGVVTANSVETCTTYGLLNMDLVLAIMNRTFVWPTYQEFRVIEE